MKSDTAFLDLIFNLALSFVFMFLVSFLMIKPVVKKANAKNKAEYIISVIWPDNNLDDIDAWLQDPLGGLVWFRNKESNMSHLDRDDLGSSNDTVVLADNSVVLCPRNQELITIRGFIPGEWVLNVHAYKRRVVEPTKVRISIDKINPNFRTVFFKEVEMVDQWQEETVCRFEMTAAGDILSFSDLPKKLVRTGDLMPRHLVDPNTEDGGVH